MKINASSFRKELEAAQHQSIKLILLKYQKNIQIKKEYLIHENLPFILDSSIKVSIQKGFVGMSLRDLCSETGLSMGGIYSYIVNKKQLLEMIMDYGYNIILKIRSENLKDIKNPRERIDNLISTHLLLTKHLHGWFYFNYKEVRAFHPTARARALKWITELDNLFLDCFKQGIKDRTFNPKMDVKFLVAAIQAMLQDWYMMHWKYRLQKISMNKFHDQLMKLIDITTAK